jgi:hypothetical protein
MCPVAHDPKVLRLAPADRPGTPGPCELDTASPLTIAPRPIASPTTVHQVADHTKLWLDLTSVAGGAKAVLARVPAVPGLYAWYCKIDVERLRMLSDTKPESLAAAILDLTSSKHCSDREGRVPPSYSITLKSSRELPRVRLQALKDACADPQFRGELLAALEAASEHLQQPLYIGKARVLRVRIESHLLGRTPLRDRLLDAGIRLERCRLLLLPLDFPAGADGVPDDEDSDTPLLLVEDILSRIHQPPFTIRYG